MNQATISGAMMISFALHTMPLNAVFQTAFLNDILVEKPGLWSGVRLPTMNDPVRHELLVISIGTSYPYVGEVLLPKDLSFLQSSPGAIFQKDNARPYVAKTVRNFCSAQYM